MTLSRALTGLCLVLAACGGSCDDDDGPPAPDLCTDPRTDFAVDGIEVGQGVGAEFAPLRSGQVIQLAFADTGEPMLPLVFRLTGSDVPLCVAQRTTVTGCSPGQDCTDGPRRYALSSVPIHTYPREDAAGNETKALFVVFGAGEDPETYEAPDTGASLLLTAEVAGQTVEIPLALGVARPDGGDDDDDDDGDGDPPVDAAPDAPIDAAPDAAVDAGADGG